MSASITLDGNGVPKTGEEGLREVVHDGGSLKTRRVTDGSPRFPREVN
jgi:hypothetical protein